MTEVAEAAAPFYNNHLRGGEGHMEVGKLILNIAKAKATMTLSPASVARRSRTPFT